MPPRKILKRRKDRRAWRLTHLPVKLWSRDSKPCEREVFVFSYIFCAINFYCRVKLVIFVIGYSPSSLIASAIDSTHGMIVKLLWKDSLQSNYKPEKEMSWYHHVVLKLRVSRRTNRQSSTRSKKKKTKDQPQSNLFYSWKWE